MATITFNASSTTIGEWIPFFDDPTIYDAVTNPSGDVFVTSATQYITRNDDGTFTIVTGTSFTYTGAELTGGTITKIEHSSDSAGTTIYAIVNNLVSANNNAAIAGPLFFAGDGTGLSAYLWSQADTMTSADGDGTYWEGGAGDDSLTGFTGVDNLTGEDGNDFLNGGASGDLIDGGNGSDWSSYSGGGAVKVYLDGSLANTGNAAGDTLIGIENLAGSGNADTLSGDANDNVLRGGGGADYLDGKGNTSGGGDWADYRNSTAVNITIGGSASGGEAAGDTLVNIENLLGGAGDDTLVGDGGDNWLRGRGGSDSLNGQGGGNDWADYFDASGSVQVYLDGSGVNTGDAAGDTIVNIENLRGSASADTLVGNSGNNVLRGGAGADSIDGGSSPFGGFGDTADYGGALSGVQISLNGSLAASGDAAGDTLTNIENLYGSNNADTLRGDNNDNWLRGRGGADSLDGSGGGNDFADYKSSSTGVAVYLDGSFANAGGEAAGDTLVNIENLRGSDFNDTLVGNSGNNVLRGGSGVDYLDGKASPFGGFGDTADYNGATSGVRIALDGSLATLGDAVGDTLVNIENLFGTGNADTLKGDNNDNWLRGRGGADSLDGSGGGNDWADYKSSSAGVAVYLDGSFANAGGEAAGDTLVNIENLRGSDFNDTLVGNSANNVLRGGAGADLLDGKASPIGGFGDTADYNGATSGVRIALDGSLATLGDAVGDTLVNIENLFGTGNADTLKGDNNDNWLRGRGGADSLDGSGGGNDWADYKSSSAGVAVYLDGSFANAGGEAAGDTLVNIENLRGSDFNDTLVGNSANNVLRGGAGADLLDGKSSPVTGFGDTADYNGAASGVQISLDGSLLATGDAAGDTLLNIENLFGTASADTLKGDAGNNWLRGRGGADVLDGGSAGSDWADYNFAGLGVAVYLDPLAGTNTNDAAGDTFLSIENLRGSTLNDTLVGDAGSNRLRGNLGNDVLTGGGDADSFQFTDVASVDTVTDFGTGGADMIGLQGAAFSAIGGTVDAGEVVLGTVAADADDYLIYDSTTSTLWYDNDGNGGNAKVAFATLTGVGSLSNTDFFIF